MDFEQLCQVLGRNRIRSFIFYLILAKDKLNSQQQTSRYALDPFTYSVLTNLLILLAFIFVFSSYAQFLFIVMALSPVAFATYSKCRFGNLKGLVRYIAGSLTVIAVVAVISIVFGLIVFELLFSGPYFTPP